MQATLTFNLPEDREDFELASKAVDYSIVLNDIDQFLRSKIKHSDATEEQQKVYEEIRMQLRTYAIERNISI